MKKILLYLLIFVLMVSGCKEEFLDKVPTTSTVIENFYKTPEDAKKGLNAVYNMLLRDDWWSLYIYSEIASDNCAGGAGSGDGGGFQRVDRGLQWSEANAHQEAWKTYFGAIFRANSYLESENKVNWTGNEALRKQYQAEAHFLRAYFHFYLTRMFGEIPAIDHTITADQIPGRSSAEDIYGLIMDDLKFCAENGLSAPYSSIGENWGRANKWAAKALAARVFLFYSGYYNKTDIKGYTATNALEYIEDVINNSGHDIVPKFASLWRVPTYSELGDINQYAGERNPEVVWSIIYNSTGNGAGSYGAGLWQRMIGPRSTNPSPYGQGWGAVPVLPAMWNLFDTTDTRRTATILSWTDEALTYDYVTQQQAQYTGFNLKKYDIASINGSPEDLLYGGSDWQTEAFEDYMVIRFADVLLMGAELNQLEGNTAKALSYTNRIRERAFGNSLHNLTSLIIEDIFLERRLELVGEGQRYWDILRSCKGDFSKLVGVLSNVDTNDGGDFSGTSDTESLDVDGNNFANKKGLFQIPKNELDLMKGAIQQNPGYN